MFWKILFNTVLVLTVFILQKSFIPFLPLGIGYANLIVTILIIVLMVWGAKSALPLFIMFGWLLDVFHFGLSGINSLALLLIFVVSFLLLKNFLTDRSMYAMMFLVGLSTWINDVIIAMTEFDKFTLGEIVNVYGYSFWLVEWKRIIANLVLTFILFYLSNKITKRIQPVFLRELKRY